MTKTGLKKPNYWGSITQAGTMRIGNYEGEEVYTPFKSLVPMVNPNDIVLGGWDISGLNMAEAMERGKVLDFELQRQLVPYMKDIVPLPGAGSMRAVCMAGRSEGLCSPAVTSMAVNRVAAAGRITQHGADPALAPALAPRTGALADCWYTPACHMPSSARLAHKAQDTAAQL